MSKLTKQAVKVGRNEYLGDYFFDTIPKKNMNGNRYRYDKDYVNLPLSDFY